MPAASPDHTHLARRLVLHVGPHKTGSTYLQNRLIRSRPVLAAAGWSYPELGIIQFAQHRFNAWAKGDIPGAADVTDDTVRALAATPENLILSSEDFVYLQSAKLEKLRDAFATHEISVVYFLRSPVDLWPSHWQELVRHGHDATLLEYLGTYAGFTRLFEPASMSPVAHLRNFAEIFGTAALRVIVYDNIVADGRDIFNVLWTDALGLAGLPPPGEARIVHPSQPSPMIEMLRNLNQLYRGRYGMTAKDRILAAYRKQQARIEATPDYTAFCAAFEQHAAELCLSPRLEIIRALEHRVLTQHGPHIINKASPDSLYRQTPADRTIRYGHRYWADRHGFGKTLASILDSLDFS